MVAPKRYAPAKQCIYCGDRDTSTRSLGDEHIIPRALGGSLILPDASCIICEGFTSRIETICTGRLEVLRPQFQIRGRKSNRVKRSLPFRRNHQDLPTSVPVHDHPSLVIVPTWGVPGILENLDPNIERTHSNHLIPVVSNFGDRLNGLGGTIAFEGVRGLYYSLMLAKISHAFASAELGVQSFHPFLPALIRGHPSFPVMHFVGNRLPAQPPSDQMHEISISLESLDDGRRYWIVRLKLFAMKEHMPTYDIVVGEPQG